MRNLVYIKVYKGFIQARTWSKNEDKKYMCSALDRPRTLAGDFDEIEAVFKKALQEQPKKLFGLIKPVVLVHLVPEMEGGYTQVEKRFFREVATFAGAGHVYTLADPNHEPLDDEDLSYIHKMKHN